MQIITIIEKTNIMIFGQYLTYIMPIIVIIIIPLYSHALNEKGKEAGSRPQTTDDRQNTGTTDRLTFLRFVCSTFSENKQI